MKRVLLTMLVCFPSCSAFAESQGDEFTVRLALRDIQVISAALTPLPWKDVSQTINKLQAAVDKQQADAQAARDAKIIEDAKKEQK